MTMKSQNSKRRDEDLSGLAITEQDLREEIAVIQNQGSDALQLVTQLGPGLNAKGKEMVITAAYQIAAADGHVDQSETQLLEEIADAMEVTPAHLRGILAGLANPAIAN